MAARRALIVGLAVALTACATLPPIVPVSEVSRVQGPWQGEIHSGVGATPVRVVILEDGTYEWSTPKKSGRGILVLQEGALHGTFSSGLAWVATLREAQGKRSLSLSVPDAGASGTLTPDE